MPLDTLPEELLERILSHALLPPSPRPAWLRSPAASLTRLAPLCLSPQLHRIATPLLYHTVHLPTPASARLFLAALQARPEHAAHVRDLTVLGVWRPVVDVLRLCRGLARLDLTIAFDESDEDGELDLEVFGTLTEMRHLSLHKPSNVYLSLPRARALINALAHAIAAWPQLRTATIAFKLSDDTPTSPIAPFTPFALASPAPAPPTRDGPITALSTALARAPALHTFATHLPSVWNTAIATVASNPALHRICLSRPHPNGERDGAGQAAIPGTGLFLMEARRHARLAELIGAGTPIIRSRAHTLGTRVPPSAPSPAPSPAPSSPTTTTPQPKPPIGLGLGLGLRIDTSDEAITGGGGGVYGSPVVASAGAGAYRSPTAGAGAINPAWMGPVRASSSRSLGRRGRR